MRIERIGFIGMGIMGAPMAANLLRAGYAVTVHSRTRAKAAGVIAAGARWAESPAATAQGADVVITCVTDTPDVEQVLLGPDGVAQGGGEGLICIDMSTISPQATKAMAARLAERGMTLLDAPVSGGQIGAVEAKLSIMIGGPAETVERVRPILEAMGRSIVHCGPVGSGQLTKLANQVMVVHTVMSMAEGLVFAKRAGLDLQKVLEATTQGAAGSHSLRVLGAKAAAGDWKPAFMVDLQLKDLRLVMETAEAMGQPLPGTALVRELLSKLAQQGRGRDGTQALFEVIEGLADLRQGA